MVEEEGLRSGQSREVGLRMSNIVTNVCELASVGKQLHQWMRGGLECI